MPARVLPPTAEAIARAADVIRRGGLVAFPTETVYGLGANALDAAAAGRIFEAKGRPPDDPLIVHLADAADLPRVAHARGPWHRLAERFWPGPLTLVLPRTDAVPRVVTAGGDTVAVRVPSHSIARSLIRAADTPIAAPSANLFARPSPTTAAHVLDDLGDRIDMVIDGGPTEVGVESTVLDLSGAVPTILRPGGVTAEQLRELVELAPANRPRQDPRSPGTAERHYSPRARVDLFDGAPAARIDDHVRALEARGERVLRLILPEDSSLAAQRLYADLRALDAASPDAIVAVLPPPGGLGTALRDRLWRAANGKVIESS